MYVYASAGDGEGSVDTVGPESKEGLVNTIYIYVYICVCMHIDVGVHMYIDMFTCINTYPSLWSRGPSSQCERLRRIG